MVGQADKHGATLIIDHLAAAHPLSHSALEICLIAGPANHGADYRIGMGGRKSATDVIPERRFASACSLIDGTSRDEGDPHPGTPRNETGPLLFLPTLPRYSGHPAFVSNACPGSAGKARGNTIKKTEARRPCRRSHSLVSLSIGH